MASKHESYKSPAGISKKIVHCAKIDTIGRLLELPCDLAHPANEHRQCLETEDELEINSPIRA
jgi:hypothetical protein